MTLKKYVAFLPISPRRRFVATAVLYGLSLAIRFTSATGEEVEIAPQAVQRANLTTSIMAMDRARLLPYVDWSQNATQPLFLRYHPPRTVSSSPSCTSP